MISWPIFCEQAGDTVEVVAESAPRTYDVLAVLDTHEASDLTDAVEEWLAEWGEATLPVLVVATEAFLRGLCSEHEAADNYAEETDTTARAAAFRAYWSGVA